MDIVKMEALLRLSSTLLLVLTACLVGFDTQTKVIFLSTVRKATFRDLNALMALVCIDSVAAAYNLLQLLRCFVSCSFKANQMQSYLCLAWVCFLLDQATVYLVVATNSAALAASFLAITGASNLQWMKLCDKYTRFCIQIGGALLCGYAASLSLALISILSGYSLFRLYSPKRFFLLKAR
ncbi:CASP-like protein 2C1 [Camellia lanceoleosa]|uniref:CASP-like protein 2C1 n=1 Tax=Camellia lanceoleosa TaxID=1840588 RepID=A0ACC0HQR2_9ERIC|nr:CASP-like protein 2C1 [Camellia lanceoleosa]